MSPSAPLDGKNFLGWILMTWKILRANGQVFLGLFLYWYMSDAPLKVRLGFCVLERKTPEIKSHGPPVR